MTIAAAERTPLDDVRARAGEILALDRSSRDEVVELQRGRLRDLLRHAVMESPYYRDVLGTDALEAELDELPTLPKPVLMDRFDDIVTERAIRAVDVQRFLATAEPGASFRGCYGCSRPPARPGPQACSCIPTANSSTGSRSLSRASRASASARPRAWSRSAHRATCTSRASSSRRFRPTGRACRD